MTTCPTCGGDGIIVTCLDDMCNGLGYCIHGDGEQPCPECHGEGSVYDPDDDGPDDEYDDEIYGEEGEEEFHVPYVRPPSDTEKLARWVRAVKGGEHE